MMEVLRGKQSYEDIKGPNLAEFKNVKTHRKIQRNMWKILKNTQEDSAIVVNRNIKVK